MRRGKGSPGNAGSSATPVADDLNWPRVRAGSPRLPYAPAPPAGRQVAPRCCCAAGARAPTAAAVGGRWGRPAAGHGVGVGVGVGVGGAALGCRCPRCGEKLILAPAGAAGRTHGGHGSPESPAALPGSRGGGAPCCERGAGGAMCSAGPCGSPPPSTGWRKSLRARPCSAFGTISVY